MLKPLDGAMPRKRTSLVKIKRLIARSKKAPSPFRTLKQKMRREMDDPTEQAKRSKRGELFVAPKARLSSSNNHSLSTKTKRLSLVGFVSTPKQFALKAIVNLR